MLKTVICSASPAACRSPRPRRARRRTGRPSRCKIMVPFGAGSTPDVVARLIADHLQKKIGQPFVIDNKPGASGNIGTDAVAKAAPDGATIGVSIGGPLAINTLLFSKLPYDPQDRHRADHPTGDAAERAGGQLRAEGQRVAELVALLKREPRQIQLRLDRQRLAVASRHGGDRAQVRHQDGARPLPSSPAGDDRDHPRRRADGLPAGDLGHAAGQGRQGENPRGLDRQAFALFAGRSDAEGERHRRRCRRLDGPDRAGRHAEGDGRKISKEVVEIIKSAGRARQARRRN